MASKHLDRIDSRIVTLLQEDARLSNTEIAKKLKISEATARGRVKRLINEKFIQIVAVSNPFKLGFEFVGNMHIRVELEKMNSVVTKLKKIKSLWYINITTGNTDVNAEFIAKSKKELNDLIFNEISKIDGIVKMETSVILQFVKRDYRYGTAFED